MNITNLTKAEQRKYFLGKRNNIFNMELKSDLICRSFIESGLYQKFNIVMPYISIKSEVKTDKLLERLIEDKGGFAAVKCNIETRLMQAYWISDLLQLSCGAYNILEPHPELIARGEIKEINKSYIDAVITPAAAFDKLGGRLGYGAGYYDRFFSDYDGVKIGFEFSECICDKLSTTAEDVPVDIIFSELGCIMINDAYRL